MIVVIIRIPEKKMSFRTIVKGITILSFLIVVQ